MSWQKQILPQGDPASFGGFIRWQFSRKSSFQMAGSGFLYRAVLYSQDLEGFGFKRDGLAGLAVHSIESRMDGLEGCCKRVLLFLAAGMDGPGPCCTVLNEA